MENFLNQKEFIIKGKNIDKNRILKLINISSGNNMNKFNITRSDSDNYIVKINNK